MGRNAVKPVSGGEALFPSYKGQRYWGIHYKYIHDLLVDWGYDMIFIDDGLDEFGTKFEVIVDGKRVLFDFSDFGHDVLDKDDRSAYDLYFKFHLQDRKLYEEGILPFAPISFYDWGRYRELKDKIGYSASGDTVVNCQRPYAGALERRTRVQSAMRAIYGDMFDVSLTGQEEYWRKINDCLVAVFVPGATNNMLDRGQWQYMAFGCATISPALPEILPYGMRLKPGVHYIKCNEDFSDLAEKIEWCRANRSECVKIGGNAKSLFESVGESTALFDWFDHCRLGFKGFDKLIDGIVD